MSGLCLEGHGEEVCRPEPEAERARELGQAEDQVAECEKSLADHAALCAATDRALRDLLAADKYLADIPFDISHEEVQDQVSMWGMQLVDAFTRAESSGRVGAGDALMRSQVALVWLRYLSRPAEVVSAQFLHSVAAIIHKFYFFGFQIAVLKGQSITVHVKREALPTLRVIVSPHCAVFPAGCLQTTNQWISHRYRNLRRQF